MNTVAVHQFRGTQERQRSLVTPEGLSLNLVVGTKGARVGALTLDFVIIGTILIVALIVLAFLGIGLIDMIDDTGEEGEIPAALEFLAVIAILFMFLLRNGYFLFFELGPKGATPGKRAARIRVASRDGGRLTAGAVIARNLLRDIELFLPLAFISTLGDGTITTLLSAAWFLLFMAFPFFNKDNLRAGDVIAGTWVVEDPRSKLDAAISTEGAAGGKSAVSGAEYRFADAELAVYGEYEVQVLEQVLRDDRREAIHDVHAAICRKIGWDPGQGDERAFLEAFYAQLRAKLEGDMRFGKRKADKYSESG